LLIFPLGNVKLTLLLICRHATQFGLEEHLDAEELCTATNAARKKLEISFKLVMMPALA
jgi:hypothetical protein